MISAASMRLAAAARSNAVRPGLRHLTLLLFVLLSACSEVVLTKPNLPLTQRPEITLVPAIALSVIDDEAGERGGLYAAQITKAIVDAYPRSVEAVAPGAAAAPGRVALSIHIRQLGAFFNRSQSSIMDARAARNGPEGTVADWDGVAAAAVGAGPTASGTVYAHLPGNWSGIAFLEIEVRDRRPGKSAAFAFVLAAERFRPNELGYMEARMAADDAWQEIAPRLVAFIDAAIRKVKAEAGTPS